METKDILAQFSLSPDDLRTMLKDPGFRAMIKEYKQEWLSASNAKERVRLKSMLATEEGLETLWAIFQDMDIAPQARLDAYKQLTNLADAQPKKDSSAEGTKFTLNIQLADHAPILIDATETLPALEHDYGE